MNNIAKYVEFLKEIQRFQQKQVKVKLANQKPEHAAKHRQTADKVTLIIDFLQSLPVDDNGDYSPGSILPLSETNSAEDLFSFAASDLEGIPESVRSALNLSPADELEGRVIELLRIAGRPLSVKELIIGLYRKYGYEVDGRNPFASKLYRMTQSNTIANVPGKKGTYTLPDEEGD